MKNINIKHYATPRRAEGERIVQNDLAYTPSQMMELTEKGIAVSNQNVNPDNFFDGLPPEKQSFEMPLYLQRGVDIADCWQAETSIKKKAKNGLKNDIRVYGGWKAPEKGAE